MADKRSFIDRLLRRTEKTVVKKDKDGKVVGQTLYQYDKTGEIIAQTDSTYTDTGRLRLVKKKTYQKKSNGDYDPYETLYYDEKDRPITERVYNRDSSGMLCCEQRKYAYFNGKKVEISRQSNTYDGGAWTTRYLEEKELDQEGGVVKHSVFEYSKGLGKLVCSKEKTYQKNEEGNYDPVETIYRDVSDHITRKKRYHREKTELDKKSVLIGKETVYTYTPEGDQRISDEIEKYHIGGMFWGSMEDLAEKRFQRQVEKLALVHVTKYMPKQEDGHWIIPSTAQATDFCIPRNRVHFTIGHHVESHYNGNWDDTPIMIVAPLKGTIDLNGNPIGMSSVDTFFETSPTQKLRMPSDAVVFIPAARDKDLKGALSKQEGNIIYYKRDHFTEKEKKEIFLKSKDRLYSYEAEEYFDGIELEDKHYITKDNISDLPDSYCSIQIKKILLEEFLKKQGSYTDSEMKFSRYESDERGCGLVAETADKLGCRWSDTSNKLDYNTDFFLNNSTIVEWYNKVQPIEFIMHSDEYQITGVTDHGRSGKEYHFKGPHQAIAIYTSHDDDIEDGISHLKHGIDIEALKKELAENAEQHPVNMEQADSRAWSLAFKATYDAWAKRTVQCLTECSEQAKGFDFENWQKKLDQRIVDYEAGKNSESKLFIPLGKQSER